MVEQDLLDIDYRFVIFLLLINRIRGVRYLLLRGHNRQLSPDLIDQSNDAPQEQWLMVE